MKLKIHITAIILILNIAKVPGQISEKISLDSCILSAKKHFALYKNNSLNQKLSELQVKNFNTNYYPQLNFEAKASYQTQTIDIDVDTQGLPPGVVLNFPAPPLDQYGASVNLNQTIYDRGITKQLKQLENQKSILNNLNTEVQFQQIKQKVNDLYFGILILKKTEAKIKSGLNELYAKQNALKSGLKNGIITRENYDLLSVNILLTKQKLIEIQENVNGNIAVLSELTGKSLTDTVQLELPADVTLTNENKRPEISVFNAQNELTETNINLVKSKRLPKLGAFAAGGYGNPGLTMIKDEWNPYFIAGAKLNWTLWDWNKTSRTKQILKINEASVENQKETFKQSVTVQLNKLHSDIEKYQKLSEYDLRILRLHEKICESMSRKLQNGTANSVDYISSFNAKLQAAVQYDIHKLKLIKCKYDYLIVTGNL